MQTSSLLEQPPLQDASALTPCLNCSRSGLYSPTQSTDPPAAIQDFAELAKSVHYGGEPRQCLKLVHHQ